MLFVLPHPLSSSVRVYISPSLSLHFIFLCIILFVSRLLLPLYFSDNFFHLSLRVAFFFLILCFFSPFFCITPFLYFLFRFRVVSFFVQSFFSFPLFFVSHALYCHSLNSSCFLILLFFSLCFVFKFSATFVFVNVFQLAILLFFSYSFLSSLSPCTTLFFLAFINSLSFRGPFLCFQLASTVFMYFFLFRITSFLEFHSFLSWSFFSFFL